LIKAARHIFSYDGKAKFTTWLFRIVINTAKDHLKKEQTKRKYEQEFAAMQELEGQGDDKSLKRLAELLTKLSIKQLEAVTLVYGEGMNHKEASLVIGCAETTISWRIFQAKRLLKEKNILVCFMVITVMWRGR
jgi:RNA polymerase sigma-70 factor (ECF subfamily)